MVELYLGACFADTSEDIASTLREIADRIEEDYTSGITNREGVSWHIVNHK